MHSVHVDALAWEFIARGAVERVSLHNDVCGHGVRRIDCATGPWVPRCDASDVVVAHNLKEGIERGNCSRGGRENS